MLLLLLRHFSRVRRRQPTRLPYPWDSPGKNTGVGCHFLLQCMKVKSESEVAQLCLTPSDLMDCSPPGSSVHGIPGKSTGVGCHCLLHISMKTMLKKKKEVGSFWPGIHCSSTCCWGCPRNSTEWRQWPPRAGWASAECPLCFYPTQLLRSRCRPHTAVSLASAPMCIPHLRTNKSA